MKKRISVILILVLFLTAFYSCGASNNDSEPTQTDSTDNNQIQGESSTITCRIVYGSKDNNLILACIDGEYDIFNLPLNNIPINWEDSNSETAELTDGMLVEIEFDGDIMEIFPAQLSGVTQITVLDDFNNLCTIYLDVLNDLWIVDSGLNSDLTELGIDLSQTRLTETEQSAVAYVFGQQHGFMPLEGTMDELIEQGYITGEKLSEDSDVMVYQWYDGCLFSITETILDSETSVQFDAEKWCSGTGAYYFTDCTTVRDNNGVWSEYELGGQAIS